MARKLTKSQLRKKRQKQARINFGLVRKRKKSSSSKRRKPRTPQKRRSSNMAKRKTKRRSSSRGYGAIFKRLAPLALGVVAVVGYEVWVAPKLNLDPKFKMAIEAGLGIALLAVPGMAGLRAVGGALLTINGWQWLKSKIDERSSVSSTSTSGSNFASSLSVA